MQNGTESDDNATDAAQKNEHSSILAIYGTYAHGKESSADQMPRDKNESIKKLEQSDTYTTDQESSSPTPTSTEETAAALRSAVRSWR